MKRASTLLLALGVSRLSVRKIAFPYCFVSVGTAICRGEHAQLSFGTLLSLRERERERERLPIVTLTMDSQIA